MIDLIIMSFSTSSFSFVALGVATAIVIFLGLVCLIVLYHLYRRRLGEYEVAQRYEEKDGEPSFVNEDKDDDRGEGNEPIYDLVPSIRDSSMDEPNNQRPRPAGETKRKVRFKINI